MIPPLIDLGPPTPWPVLPPGVHWATLGEIEQTFATNERRRWLFDGFVMVAVELSSAGCKKLYLDGSFVTGKPHPKDFDACWDPSGVRAGDLDAVLLDTANRRAQKAKYRGDVVPFNHPEGGTFFELFQTDEESGRAKGIVGLDLTSEAWKQKSNAP